jgi:DNA modification methylase
MADPRILVGDCRQRMAELPEASVDAIVTDPPYGLGFMGKEWDDPKRPMLGHAGRLLDGAPGTKSRGYADADLAAFGTWCQTWATEALRVLKPGGHLVAFGGTRTWHRLACAVEDAGFEIRDTLAWLYGSGFPKSLDVSKAIDKAKGAEREPGTPGPYSARRPRSHVPAVNAYSDGVADHVSSLITAPATAEAQAWQGWGTALKPAHEPVILARRPLDGTVAANVTRHGVGALNIDGCRIGTADGFGGGRKASSGFVDGYEGDGFAVTGLGRWPANVVLDEEAAAILDEQTGETYPSHPAVRRNLPADGTTYEASAYMIRQSTGPDFGYWDSGGASRFFYVAKADASERPEHDGTRHPTVKPLALMRWLVRLVTPPGGVVLDPFLGSGTTAEAALLEGFDWLGCELTTEYVPLVEARIARVARGESPGQPPKPQPPQQVEGQLDLFGEAS